MNQEMEIRNAIIESVTITSADHGVLSAWLYLDYGGAGQGFGGHALYLPESFKHHKKGMSYAGHFLFRCMEIAGVEKWENIKGKTIRVKCNHSNVQAIGHIVKEDWFDPSIDFKQLKELDDASRPL